MKCYIDIENSKTQKVETLCVNIIKYEEDKEAIFDISTLNSHELEILKDAINDDIYIDGVKLDFPKAWVHLRKSNTEPIIRVYSEASTMEEADALGKKLMQVVYDMQK